MKTIILKYPAGEFTQAELAVFNGMEKAAVYLPMREAIANGTLSLSGTRPTGGKRPSNVYQVASNNAPVALPVIFTAPPADGDPLAPPVAPLPVPVPLPAQSISEAPPIVSTPPLVNPKPNPQPVVSLVPNPEFLCPLCEGPMIVTPDSEGVTVICINIPCDPQCHENVFGHGRNAQDAYKIAKDKFQAP